MVAESRARVGRAAVTAGPSGSGRRAGRTVLLWVLAFLVTAGSAVWQRMSGPSYPAHIRQTVGSVTVSGRLGRSQESDSPLQIAVRVSPPDADVTGLVEWRRYPGDEPWQRRPLQRDGEELQAELPPQPPAGKVEYRLRLDVAGEHVAIPAGEAIVARFKGAIPTFVLVPHVLVMFLGMLWATRAGLEALAGGTGLRRQSGISLCLFLVGGFVLGPIVQELAFGSFWTGWPVGEDLTDNKLAVAVLAWLLAFWRSSAERRQRTAGPSTGRWWVLGAALVTMVVFAIPHSLLGSTLDYQTMETISG
jgi:hypothetical protein